MAESQDKKYASIGRGTLTRGRSTFLTKTATDDAGELLRRSSLPTDFDSNLAPTQTQRGVDVSTHDSQQTRASSSQGKLADRAGDAADEAKKNPLKWLRRGKPEDLEADGRKVAPVRTTATLRPVGGTGKLDTFSGVFVPTTLNVLSILMFIRFGFILGQTGLLGMIGLLMAAYIINLVTTFSISAVASNGTVRGGGAYYLISRSLGPEFGGSIGIVSYLGFVLNTGMNAVGLIDCLVYNFGSESGIRSGWLPESGWWTYLWASCVVLLCVVICLAGSAIFARASNGLLFILLVATLSIPISSAFKPAFERAGGQRQHTHFTGLDSQTLKNNLLPRFTKGAAGSQVKGKETWADMFGILFPATGGIFAGASMSGDLKNPSKSIPRGTLYGILLTFMSYTLVILAMAASISRKTFYENVNVVQDVNLSGALILLGEMATTLFSVLMGIVGPAKQLQAIARDGILPGVRIFGRGTKKTDDPIYAILFTWFVAQVAILFDINSIASLVTMSYLMMNFALHSACLLLKVSSAPNFRPSFRYFNAYTAAFGALISVATMFFVDAAAAGSSIAFLVFLFLVIHYTTPPKAWGTDVTAGLVYHQVRKYLLRLKTESVKYWRPQILLFVNDPRRGYKLVSFCNSLKKGGLFILGHVIVTDDFGSSVPEARKQKAAWTKYIDFIKIKAFVNVAVSPSMEWGTRNLVFSAGLGGMRPNIVILGCFNLEQFRREQPLIDVPEAPPERTRNSVRKRRRSVGQVKGALPTDTCYVEKRTDMQSYVLCLEDLILKLQMNVAVATGFSDLELPDQPEGTTKKYIDLWPIQMSTISPDEEANSQQNITTINFDTYTLILQLGCILNTVPAWKKAYKLRVAVFVEYESDVQEERERVTTLLEDLRISAEVLVFYLDHPDLKSYQHIINGEQVDSETEDQVAKVLEDEEWWSELQEVRGKIKSGVISADDVYSTIDAVFVDAASPFPGKRDSSAVRSEGLLRILQTPGYRHRQSLGQLSSYGAVSSMRTHRLDDDLLSRHASQGGSDLGYTDEGSDSNSNTNSEQFHDDSDDSENEVNEQSTEENSVSRLRSGKSSKRSSRKSVHSSDGNSRPVFANITNQGRSLIEFDSTSSKNSDNNNNSENYDKSSNNIMAKYDYYDNDENDDNNDTEDTDETRHGRKIARYDSLEAEPDISPSTQPPDPFTLAVQPDFTATLLPAVQATNTETPTGPSITFAEQKHPHSSHTRMNTQAESRAESQSQSQFQPYTPLSFNTLPSRAQHLILNDLLSTHTPHTAVLFTTLPPPTAGTWSSESDSLRYLTDLEVFTAGLCPTVMVHSCSITVTTNL